MPRGADRWSISATATRSTARSAWRSRSGRATVPCSTSCSKPSGPLLDARAHAQRSKAAPLIAAGGLDRSQGARTAAAGVNRDSPSDNTAGLPGYSPDSVLRRKPFDECSADDLAAMERLLARLARQLATRRSRRLVPSHRGAEMADLRRSFRRAIGTGGELVSLAWRARAMELPRLVVLCDTSGSMDRHARFLLAFVVALKRVARGTEIFVFNTSLIRITSSVASGRIARTIARLAANVPDWSGGTKIGECLSDFVARYLDRFVTKQDGRHRVQRRPRSRRYDAGRDRHAGHPIASREGHLAQSAGRRSTLRADRASDGGGAAVHRSARSRARSRVARTPAARADRLSRLSWRSRKPSSSRPRRKPRGRS